MYATYPRILHWLKIVFVFQKGFHITFNIHINVNVNPHPKQHFIMPTHIYTGFEADCIILLIKRKESPLMRDPFPDELECNTL
jgi:hypothetical protein